MERSYLDLAVLVVVPVALFCALGVCLLPCSNARRAAAEQPAPVPAHGTSAVPEISDCPESLALLPAEFQIERDLNADRLIVVFKRVYRVGLYRNGLLARDGEAPMCYPIAMGAWPYEAKFESDGESTPEGWYHVGLKLSDDPADGVPKTSFHRGLLIDYPNAEDVAHALREDVVPPATADALLSDVNAGKVPSQETHMGGAILIHGYGASVKNWTAGCVALEDEDVDILWEQAEVGDPILSLAWVVALYEDGSNARDWNIPVRIPNEIDIAPLIDEAETRERGHIVLVPLVITAGT